MGPQRVGHDFTTEQQQQQKTDSTTAHLRAGPASSASVAASSIQECFDPLVFICSVPPYLSPFVATLVKGVRE